ncbi:hypothetical protein ACFP1Z_31885 [Streptomyces gamaensis]|uniref:Uncharacterized protein n=1 Tax=Streptomyces gamaensis TaxID=1763542 RepID=A0ABW0Z7I0_9ACTN
MKKVFPYPILSGAVVLDVDEVVVDNKPRPLGTVSNRERVIALYDVKADWDEIRIKVSVTADEVELSQGPWNSPVCVAVVRNTRTKVRHTFPLRSLGSGSWRGEVELRRGEQIDWCEIDAWIVAEVDGEVGRKIGAAEGRWRADFEAKQPTKQRSIKMMWKDFTDDTNPEFVEFRDDPWLLDAQSDEPVLYLNSSVEGFRAILENAATPEQKLVRELMASQIAAEAWTAMFNSALFTCDLEDGQAQWPGGWHEDVLKRMLPDLFTDRSLGEALTELVERRAQGENGGDLQRRLMHAVSLQSRRPKTVAGTLKTLGRTTNAKETV